MIRKLVVESTNDGPNLNLIRFDNNPDVLIAIGRLLVVRIKPHLAKEIKRLYELIKLQKVSDCTQTDFGHKEPAFVYLNFYSVGCNHDVAMTLMGGDVMLDWSISGIEAEFCSFYEMLDFENLIEWLAV